MCQICASVRPHLVAPGDCDYKDLAETSGTNDADNANGIGARGQTVIEVDDIAGYLQDGYWSDKNWYSFDYSHDSDGIITYHVGDLNAEGRYLAELALDTWEDVSGLQFQAVSNKSDAQLQFDDEVLGRAYASTSIYTSGPQAGQATSSTINVGKDWIGMHDGTAPGNYAFSTYLHEIGHALGLGHTGNYNGSANYGSDGLFDQDSYQTSVMSYFGPSENPNVDVSYGFAGTLMQADIIAIQNMYGLETSTRTGDTTYGDNSTAGGYLDGMIDMLNGVGLWYGALMTLYDDGGTDTLDLSSGTAAQRIDLTPGTASDALGRTGNIVIDRSTIIENAVGGAGHDHITGNAAGNHLRGNDGDDTLVGGLGNDTVDGGAGTGDEILLGGNRADYTFADVQSGGLALTHTPTGEIDTSYGIEWYSFADQRVSRDDLEAGNEGEVWVADVDGWLHIDTGGSRIQVLDAREKGIRWRDFKDWTFEGGLAENGQYALVWRDAEIGLLREWIVNADGSISAAYDTKGAMSLARLEAKFGDIDGDGQIAPMQDHPELIALDKTLRLSTATGDLQLTNLAGRGKDVRDNVLRDWTFAGAREDGATYRVVMTGEDGLLREWVMDGTGAVTSDTVTTGAVSLARLEAIYGDLNGDGQIAAMPDGPALIIVDKVLIVSTAQGDVSLVDANGRDIKDSALKKLTVVALSGTPDGFSMALRDEDGGLVEWSIGSDGAVATQLPIVGQMALARLEAIHGDLDADGSVQSMPSGPEIVSVKKALMLSTDAGYVALTNLKGRGRDIRDSELKDWTVDGIVSDGTGHRIVMSNEDGTFREWHLDATGAVTSEDFSTGTVALARLEAVYGDIDGDGQIQPMPTAHEVVSLNKTLWISTPDGHVALLDDRGRPIKDAMLRDWTAVAATELDDGGFRVAFQDEDGVFQDWTVSADGTVTGETLATGQVALSRLEAIHGDIDGDGQVDAMPDRPELVVVDKALFLAEADGDLAVVDTRGKAMRDTAIKNWAVGGAGETADGYRVVLVGPEGALREWTLDSNGMLQSESVSEGDVALARLEAFYGDINGDGQVQQMPDDPEVITIDRALMMSTASGDVGLTDDRGRALKDSVLKKLSVVDTLADANGFQVVVKDKNDVMRHWTFDSNGAQTGDAGVAGTVMLARLEALFGDLDGDGQVTPIPSDPELVAVDKALVIATASGDIAVVDDRDRALKENAIKDWTPLRTIESDDAFTVILQSEDGLYNEWTVSTSGRLTQEFVTAGSVALARFEAEHGDVNGDGQVAAIPDRPELIAVSKTLKLALPDSDVALTDARGKALKDSLLKKLTVGGTVSDDYGLGIVFVDGEGVHHEWRFDQTGVLQSETPTTGAVALARLEAIYGDIDGNGTVNSMPDAPEIVVMDRKLHLSTADSFAPLLDERGREISERALPDLAVSDVTETQGGVVAVLDQTGGGQIEWVFDANNQLTETRAISAEPEQADAFVFVPHVPEDAAIETDITFGLLAQDANSFSGHERHEGPIDDDAVFDPDAMQTWSGIHEPNDFAA